MSLLPSAIDGTDPDYSAFWGESFVAELNRISAAGERKLKARRASLIRGPTTAEPKEIESES